MAAAARIRLFAWAALVAVVGAGCEPSQPRTATVRVFADEPLADPVAARAADDRAADLIAADKLDAALAQLRRAVAADPSFGPAQNNLGIVQMRLGHPSAAVAAFDRAGQLMPRAAPPRDNLGLLFESAGRFDDAVRCYDAAVALAPTEAEYAGNAARARVRRGDHTDELHQMLVRVANVDRRPAWNDWARQALAHWDPPATRP